MKTRQHLKETSEKLQTRKKIDKTISSQIKPKLSLKKLRSPPQKRKKRIGETLLSEPELEKQVPIGVAQIPKLTDKPLKKPPRTPSTTTKLLQKLKKPTKSKAKEKLNGNNSQVSGKSNSEKNVTTITPLKKIRQKATGKALGRPKKIIKNPTIKQKRSKVIEKAVTSQEDVKGSSNVSNTEAKVVALVEPAPKCEATLQKPVDEKLESETKTHDQIQKVHSDTKLSDICFYITEDEAILNECQIKEEFGGELEEHVLVTDLNIEIPHFVPIENLGGLKRQSRRKQNLEPETLEDTTSVAYEKRHRKHELTEKKMKNREQELLAHQEYKKRLMMEELRHLKINKRTRTNRVSHPLRHKNTDPTDDATPVPCGAPEPAESLPTPTVVDTHILLATIKRQSITRRANEIPLILPNPLFFQVDFDLPHTYDNLKRRKGSS
ncbi:hypothetical protein K7432_006324 [Basidiobolus ranarum]|uniref:Uncharacterized protein n=1 Tax=Basidiobolus ranarum TaxID=34480 RepID=A0ABR2WVC2_9FUNG